MKPLFLLPLILSAVVATAQFQPSALTYRPATSIEPTPVTFRGSEWRHGVKVPFAHLAYRRQNLVDFDALLTTKDKNLDFGLGASIPFRVANQTVFAVGAAYSTAYSNERFTRGQWGLTLSLGIKL